MPLDKAGKFKFTSQQAAHSDKMMGEKPKAKGMGGEKAEEPKESQSMSELHDHGDGTFHTKTHDGEVTEHPHIGHALMHMAGKHAEGKHLHMHHDGGSITSHHHDGMDVQGPQEHGSAEEAGQHAASVMGDGEEPEDGGAADNEPPMHAMGGMVGMGY